MCIQGWSTGGILATPCLHVHPPAALLPTMSAPPLSAGFGGPKRLRKQNDASSAADVDGYKPSRFDDGVARKAGKKFGGKGGGGGGFKGR